MLQSVSSVVQSCLTFCSPMDCSTPGFPVHHQLSELAQTHVHRVGNVIQPSHPLSFPSPPVFNISQHQDLFLSVLHIRWRKYWSFSFSISPSMHIQDWFPLGLTGLILKSKGLSRVFFNIRVQRSNSLVLSFCYGPTLTSIHDYWENHRQKKDQTEFSQQSKIFVF